MAKKETKKNEGKDEHVERQPSESETTGNFDQGLIQQNVSFPTSIIHNRKNFFYFTFYDKVIRAFDDPSYNSTWEEQLELQNELNTLKKQFIEATKAKDRSQQDLEKLVDEIQAKEQISHILPRICEPAREKLLKDTSFKDAFEDSKESECVVVSIDIRRSTELMLKARTAKDFSGFITGLSQKLAKVIIENFGIFDKFTGDGILAFFPKFYSGDQAIVRALVAAEECHKIFHEHYNDSRECFSVFIKNVGLGIGVDYGKVTLVNNGNEFTVVGIPVVYACRMSGADAGHTLLNQPAKEEVCRLHEKFVKIIESEIAIKNEGIALAYEVELTEGIKSSIPDPDWM